MGTTVTGSNDDFAALLAEFDSKAPSAGKRRVAVGDLVKGTIISLGRDTVVVALDDGRTEGILDLVELADSSGEVKWKQGDTVEARVGELGEKRGVVILRRLLRKGPEARAELQKAFELGIPVEGTVTSVNKGGVDVNVAGVRAFCPISQLELRGVEDPAPYIGQKFAFKITKHEEDRRGVNLVVSRRALMEEEARSLAVQTRAKLVPGAVMPGTVTSIRDFGAFVDLGGIEGLLPASEISFSRGVKVSEVLSIGQNLQVQVMRIEKTDDPRRPEKLSLSLKALIDDPWDEVTTRFPVGTKVTTKIMRVEAFGAFAEIVPGIEGLVHIGELSGGKQIRHAREIVKPGDTLELSVLSIDRERRRISLGIGNPGDEVDPEAMAVARQTSGMTLGTLGDLFKAAKK